MPGELTRPDSIVLVNQSSRSFSDVTRVAAALQQQVLQHLRPVWGVFASIIARNPGESLPDNAWCVYLKDALDARLSGVHYYKAGGAPYALVSTVEDSWSISASHEVLEMLADPKTDTFRRAMDPNRTVGLVDYLMEICDPCQHDSCAYKIDNVWVSDFYGPSYFDVNTEEGRLSVNNKIRRPLQILPGGYVSFRDARGDMYIATTMDGQQANYRKIVDFHAMPGETAREQIDFATAMMPDIGYHVPLSKLSKKKQPRGNGDKPVPFGCTNSECQITNHMRHAEEVAARIKRYDAEQLKRRKK